MMPGNSPRLGKRKLPPPMKLAPDWPWIKRQYRIGLKSTREIARESTAKGRKISHAAIEKRAHKEGWERDLKPAVIARVGAELAADAVDAVDRDGASPEEIVEAAAHQGAEVIRSHRHDIGRSRQIEAMLFEQLQEATRDVRDLEGLIRAETEPPADASASQRESFLERRKRLMRLIGLPQRATIFKDLVQAQRHRIGLERQAWNLNDETATPDSIEERLARLEDE